MPDKIYLPEYTGMTLAMQLLSWQIRYFPLLTTKKQFSFTGVGQQCMETGLPEGYIINSPVLYHNVRRYGLAGYPEEHHTCPLY